MSGRKQKERKAGRKCEVRKRRRGRQEGSVRPVRGMTHVVQLYTLKPSFCFLCFL